MQAKRWSLQKILLLLSVCSFFLPLLVWAEPPEDEAEVSYESLTEVVSQAMDENYQKVQDLVATFVENEVKKQIGDTDILKEAIEGQLVPLLKDMIENQFSNFSGIPFIQSMIEQAAKGPYMEQLLKSEIAQEIRDSTLHYGAQEVVNQLGIDQKKEEGIKSIVDQVWNTPFVSVGNAQTKVKSPKKMRSIFGNINNPSYYQFTVTEWNTWNLLFFSVKTSPKQIEVTGWNTKRIKPLTMMNTAFQSVMNLEYYQKNLDKLDHKLIIEQAFLKALKEVCQKHLPSFLQPTESDEAKQV